MMNGTLVFYLQLFAADHHVDTTATTYIVRIDQR